MLVLVAVVLPMIQPASAQQAPPADVIAEVVVEDLDDPTDFSVTSDGNVVFIAERGAGQILRVQGETRDVAVCDVKSVNETELAQSISVHAINAHQILVGVSGFSSPEESLCQFNISAGVLPLDFVDEHVRHARSYERVLKRSEGFSVLSLFREQRGLVMVCRFGDAPPTLCEIHFKDGKLEKLTDLKFESNSAKLSTLTVDQMGGYLVGLSRDEPNRIVFYRVDRSSMQSFPIDLENIVALSFSPRHNRLFALVNHENEDANKSSTKEGIYEILADDDACKVRFVISIDRPEKLKFDDQGAGWVLCRSQTENGLGLLKKINNLDVSPSLAQQQKANDD